MSATEPAKSTARSPFAGCAIFICVGLVIVFLIFFSIFSFYRQFGEIAKFTDETPAPVEVTRIEDRESDLNSLAERLEGFRQQLVDGKESSLELSADDMNTAIAAYEPLKDFRGTLRITEIRAGDMLVAVSFPLNGKPRLTRAGEQGTITTDHRYLNGTLVAVPEVVEGEVVLRISDIQVPGKTVAPEFIDRMSPHRLTERYKTDPTLGPAMKNLSGAAIADGKVVLRRKEGEKSATTFDRAQVDSATNRLFKFFAVGASAFLIFVAGVIFLGLRRKSKAA